MVGIVSTLASQPVQASTTARSELQNIARDARDVRDSRQDNRQQAERLNETSTQGNEVTQSQESFARSNPFSPFDTAYQAGGQKAPIVGGPDRGSVIDFNV